MLDKKISQLTDSANLTGDELVAVVQGNVTVKTTTQDIADLATVSVLFPNGVKLVMSSRAFQADDKDYVLLCPVPGTIITMPTTNPFSEGDYIGVVMSSPDSYFETYNNGSGGTDKMYPFTANPTGTTLEQQSSSEVVILRALNQGTLWILPLCGAVKYSTDINGSNFKTLARYNYDESSLRFVISKSASTTDADFNAAPGTAYMLSEVADNDKVITLTSPVDGDIYRFNNVTQPTNNWITNVTIFLSDGTTSNVVPASKITIIQYDAAASVFHLISSQ